MSNKNTVNIVEVGPRDGLQNEKTIVSTQDKQNYIRLLADAGLKSIEVTSFVKPSAIPQMSDSRDLFLQVKDLKTDINLPCLVPNLKGMETAIEVGVEEIALFSATSNTFNKRNINTTIEGSFERMTEVAELAKQNNIRMRGYISTAFGCPYEGDIGVSSLIDVMNRFFKLGVYEVSIGDTIGVARPAQVRAYLNTIKDSFDMDKVAMHFHDTRGMALANILTSLDFDISTFDSSSGGLGGCPYAKGATGNVATEDVWYLLEGQGLNTGVNLEKLMDASKFILNCINKTTTSKFLAAKLKEQL